MPDIAIIYANEDREFAASLYAALSQLGWVVWWDERLTGESFPREIQAQLEVAGCVIVLWSRFSVARDWVKEEGRFVKELHRPLVQVKLEQVVVPIPFGQDEVIELTNWNKESHHLGFVRLLRRIEQHIGLAKAKWDGKRPLRLRVGSNELPLPCFFASVSSYESQLQPDAAIKALELFRADSILVSAYDLANAENPKSVIAALKRLRGRGCVVLVDSGNYESYRKGDNEWSATRFRRALVPGTFDIAFCFDNLRPPLSVTKNITDLLSRVTRDRKAAKTNDIVPIIHIPIRKGTFYTAIAPDLFARVSEELQPPLIAVPERELGGGVIERARIIWEIRKKLNSLGRYQPIHLLGTGNPLSLAIFAASGADTFDGLEWCRTVADHETALLYHFQQYDFFRHQTRSAQSAVVRAAADDQRVSFNAKVAFHNLEFFRVWTRDIQKDIAHGRISRLLRDFLPKGSFRDLANALPGVFER